MAVAQPLITSTIDTAKGADKWLAYGDSMRFLGVAAVLLVHTCDMIVFGWGKFGTHDWWVANFIDASGRWAVPVFIMLSGALLLHPSRDESAAKFYRRRLARLGVPIIVWSAFFMWFSLYFTKWSNFGWNEPKSIWKSLLLGQPYMHLHFVFRLFGLYAITPLLRVYVRHAPLGLRAGMAILILLLGMGNSIIVAILGLETSAFALLWPFLGFYLMGDVLRHVKVNGWIMLGSCIAAVLCIVTIAVGTGWIIPPTPETPKPFPSLDMMLYDFLSPFRVILSISAWFILAFIFGRYPKESPVQKVFSALAPLTLGMYLIHPLFRELMYIGFDWKLTLLGKTLELKLEPFHFDKPDVWLGILIGFAVLLFASTLVTYLIRLVPGLRRIMG